eukprot:1269541-Ditylum_brightwellii.AAC.1
MGFVPSRADQDLWLHRLDKHVGYDYIAMHVDDIIIFAKNPSKYMMHIEQHFQENLPLKPKVKPELDDYPLVDNAKHKEYQHII